MLFNNSRINYIVSEIEKDYTKETGKIPSVKEIEILKQWVTKLQKTLKKSKIVKTPAKKSVKKAPVKKALAKKTRAQESEAIRQKVRKDGFIMPHGYAVRKAVREQSIGALSIDQLKKNTEAIERFTTKHIPYMLAEYKTASAGQKAFIKKRILEAKKYVATLKKLNTNLKRHIK
jgi:cell division protein YceG involved in septum cleavage